MSVGILITLPGDVVNGFLIFGGVVTENFPVETSVFKTHFSVERLAEMFSNASRTGEEGIYSTTLFQNLFNNWAIRVQEVHIFFWKTTVVEHADPLLKDERSSGISFCDWLVAHVECSHKL